MDKNKEPTTDKKKHPGGRPPMFKTVDEMQEKIDDYFDSCEGTALLDKDDNPVFNKWGMPVIINQKPLTVTGLALYLGFNGRQSLLNYQFKQEFVDAILRAKARVEEYNECRLYDKDGCNGAKFSLVNNFGWENKKEVEHSGEIKMPSITIGK